MSKCVVLTTTRNYSDASLNVLRDILAQKPDLLAVVGTDCAEWEEAMDWLCLDLDLSGEQPGAFCNTTSHPNESLADVIAFAEEWCELKGWARDVRVVHA